MVSGYRTSSGMGDAVLQINVLAINVLFSHTVGTYQATVPLLFMGPPHGGRLL